MWNGSTQLVKKAELLKCGNDRISYMPTHRKSTWTTCKMNIYICIYIYVSWFIFRNNFRYDNASLTASNRYTYHVYRWCGFNLVTCSRWWPCSIHSKRKLCPLLQWCDVVKTINIFCFQETRDKLGVPIPQGYNRLPHNRAMMCYFV